MLDRASKDRFSEDMVAELRKSNAVAVPFWGGFKVRHYAPTIIDLVVMNLSIGFLSGWLVNPQLPMEVSQRRHSVVYQSGSRKQGD